MELKLGSVWLLLSCSLQQSLWGILASVPQTTAKKCTHKISDTAEVRKVQMLKRIPARCSGWDEAWSWLSQKDCRTKYKMDYMELPRAVQKVDDKDCTEEEGEASASEGGNYFNVSDEKFLAIAFGSATVALLILILIIVVSLVRRGQICVKCCASPSYTTANAAEGDDTEVNQQSCNTYLEASLKLMESEYEEIMDPSTREKKLALQQDHDQRNKYQNVPLYPGEELKSMEAGKFNTSNGTVVPSAPYEEDLNQTNTHSTCRSVPNDYSAFLNEGTSVKTMQGSGEGVSRFTPVGKDLVERNSLQQQCNGGDASKSIGCNRFEMGGDSKSDGVTTDTKKNCDNGKDEKDSKDSKEETEKPQNEYSKFDDLINSKDGENGVDDTGSFTDYEEPLSAPISSHSYENLDPLTQESNQNATVYDSLAQSPVYHKPENVTSTTESGSSPSRSHVTMNGVPSDHVITNGFSLDHVTDPEPEQVVKKSPQSHHVTLNGSLPDGHVTMNGVQEKDEGSSPKQQQQWTQGTSPMSDAMSTNSSDLQATS